MSPEQSLRGSRLGMIQWVEQVQVMGKPHFRLTYRFVHEYGEGHQTTLAPQQVYNNPFRGDRARFYLSGSRVLRVDKAC